MSRMKVFKCKICGDPYIGYEKPSNCPFCGAHYKHIVLAENYKEPKIENLSALSRQNLEKALEIEISNSKFYLCATNKAETEFWRSAFKALYKVEAEHASTIEKALKMGKPPIELEIECCYNTEHENINESHHRETRAIEFYSRAAKEAEEPRVKEIFTSFVEIEKDHLELSENAMKDESFKYEAAKPPKKIC